MSHEIFRVLGTAWSYHLLLVIILDYLSMSFMVTSLMPEQSQYGCPSDIIMKFDRKIRPYQATERQPYSKVHGANMGPIWGRQDPGGPHVGPMNLVIWEKHLMISITVLKYCTIALFYYINILMGECKTAVSPVN